MKLKAVVFDLDDTLLETFKASYNRHEKVALALGLKMPSKKDFYSNWGLPWNPFISRTFSETTPEIFRKKYYEVNPNNFVPLIDGAKQCLDFFIEQDFFIGILTSRERSSVENRLRETGLFKEAFEKIYAVDETNVHKPDPRVFDGIKNDFKSHGISPSEALYVGDNVVDFKAASGAGLEFAGVLTGVSKKELFVSAGLHQSLIVSSVKQVPKLALEKEWVE